jgi:hypothetical protein
VVTVDNQKAIGRAYWGPLGDTFVTMVGAVFGVYENADGSLSYKLESIDGVVITPAWLLLRPGSDPIASAIPADARQRILALDPFLTNLDKFLPTDTGVDLSLAANAYNDPTVNNRAELIGVWWMDAGTELNYSQGQSRELQSTETNELSYTSSVTIDESATGYYDAIFASVGVTATNTTTISFQSSQETDQGASQTASCFLMHNQNDRNIQGIGLYYDKIFSTFMLRQLNCSPSPVRGSCVVQGSVSDYRGYGLRGLTVFLLSDQGVSVRTNTRFDGSYSFYNLQPGTWTLTVGDKSIPVTLLPGSSPVNPTWMNVTAVRRTLNLKTSPIWEFRDALGLSTPDVRALGRQILAISDLTSLAKAIGASAHIEEHWSKVVSLVTGESQ